MGVCAFGGALSRPLSCCVNSRGTRRSAPNLHFTIHDVFSKLEFRRFDILITRICETARTSKDEGRKPSGQLQLPTTLPTFIICFSLSMLVRRLQKKIVIIF